MESYSNEEKVDMMEIYFKANRNAAEACRVYEESYPERRQPNERYFRKLITNLLECGRFEKQRPKNYEMENEERSNVVVNHVTHNASTSVRNTSREVDVPKTTVHRILKNMKYHPYKPTIVQGFQANDYERRLRFCQWFIQKSEEDEHFSSKILWCDETRFTNCGVFNKHNTHHWSIVNPHITNERRFQNRFGFNVWCGIKGNRLIGPFIFNFNLNGERYLQMLQHQIIPALGEIEEDFNEVWFQQDGCPAHNVRNVIQYLQDVFNNRLIANNGGVLWPARSPDLNPLDFYLWGHIKNEVYGFEAPETIEILEERVRNAVALINRNTLQRVTNSVLNRTRMCMEQQGGHFEQFT